MVLMAKLAPLFTYRLSKTRIFASIRRHSLPVGTVHGLFVDSKAVHHDCSVLSLATIFARDGVWKNICSRGISLPGCVKLTLVVLALKHSAFDTLHGRKPFILVSLRVCRCFGQVGRIVATLGHHCL